VDLILLKQELFDKINGFHKLVFLGIGTDMKGDDAFGPVLARILDDEWDDDRIISLDGGTVPENFTGVIKKETPSHIMLIDAVEMKKEPGHIRLVDKDEISNYSISTHALPISFLIKYLEKGTNAKISLLGVQPKDIDLGEEISEEVQTSIKLIINIFRDIIPR
jgi:hydrogenase 3 maturation protease